MSAPTKPVSPSVSLEELLSNVDRYEARCHDVAGTPTIQGWAVEMARRLRALDAEVAKAERENNPGLSVHWLRVILNGEAPK